jgi:phosphoglycolate phosphatase
MVRTLLLDLDGTLVDTVPDLRNALNWLMQRRGLPSFSRDQVAAMVGDGVGVLLQRAFSARGRDSDADAHREFMGYYEDHIAVESKIYPDVEPVLAELRQQGWHLAVCTNKPENAARELLRAIGLLPMICAVGGGDSFPTRKPDPAHMLATLALAEGVADHAVMVGDHRNDVRCASGTGVVTIFAAWGYGTPDMAEGAVSIAQNMRQAAIMANQLRPHTAD